MSMQLDFTAAAASSSLTQYSVVTLTTSDTVKHTTAAGARAHGILQNDPTSTAHMGSYRVFGDSWVRPTSDAVEVGNPLTAATAGKVQASTASSAQYNIGFALEAISASTGRGTNDKIRAFINITGLGLQ